nr:phospholipase D family protein [Marinicella sp. W31]MDC2877217.1 phospholipase D family protein [Marinicella sp. W31]
MKYYDVFSETGFHSAFMTTYAFSAQAFEDVPFPKLRGAGCRNIAILADKAMLNMSFAEYGAPRYAGALYHLAKVSVGGAFHPKMTLLVGPEKGRLLIGSANLTALGLAGNKELVADVRYSATDKDNAALFGEALNYLRSYVPAEDPWFGDALSRAFRYSPWLREAAEIETPGDQSDIRLLADKSDQTFLDQIEAAVAGDEIERLVVLSPYWDAKLEGLTRLREVLGMPPTDILIDPLAAQFPASVLDGATVELFDLRDETVLSVRPCQSLYRLRQRMGPRDFRQHELLPSGSAGTDYPKGKR